MPSAPMSSSTTRRPPNGVLSRAKSRLSARVSTSSSKSVRSPPTLPTRLPTPQSNTPSGGEATLPQSFQAVKIEGTIAQIGFLGAAAGKGGSSLEQLARVFTHRGVYVGSRAQFVDMNRSIEANGIKPVIDATVFDFADAKAAYTHQMEAKHIGRWAQGEKGRVWC